MRRLLPLSGLLLLAALLAARWLAYDLLFVDEWWSIFKSGGDIYGPLSPLGVIDRIVTVDPGGMGAGYYVTLGLWEMLVGATPFAARAYSLLFGLLAIAMTFRLGATWFSPRIGVFAAAFMASSAFFLNFMHEARAYTLVAFVACCVVYSYWRLITAPAPRWQHYAALTLSLAALAYSHYVALSLAVVMGVYHLFFVRNDRRKLYGFGAMFAAALLYVPWLPVLADVAQRGAGDVNRQADSMNAAQAIETLAQAFSNGSPALLALLLVAALLYVFRRRVLETPLASAALNAPTPQSQTSTLWWRIQSRRLARATRSTGRPARASTGSGQPSTLLVLWGALGLGVALTVNALVPFLVHLRYLIFLWPALALLCALGVEALRRRGVPVALVVGVWVVFGVLRGMSLDFNRSLFGEIYRPPAAGVTRAVAVLDDLVAPDDLVLFHIQQPEDEPFGLFIEDYLTRNLPYPVAHAQTQLMNNSFAQTDAEYRADVTTILGSHPRVWILDVPEVAQSQRTRTLMDTLAETYVACGAALTRDDATLNLYVLRPDVEALRQAPPFEFGSDETGFARMTTLPNTPLGEQGIRQDELFSLVLGWSAQPSLRGGTHSVAVHVVNADGAVVAQDDYPLPTGGYGCRMSVLPAGLPNGQYDIYVSVYDWQTLVPLPVPDSADGRLRVGTLTIAR